MILSKDMIYLTAGLFVLIAAVGTTYYISQNDNAYYCQAENTVGVCFKLSAVNSNGLQTRCYYNVSAPTKYNYCKSGWVPYKNITVTGKLINISNIYKIQKNGDQYEIWHKSNSFNYKQAIDKYKNDVKNLNKAQKNLDFYNNDLINGCLDNCPNLYKQDKQLSGENVDYFVFYQECLSNCQVEKDNLIEMTNQEITDLQREINLLKELNKL